MQPGLTTTQRACHRGRRVVHPSIPLPAHGCLPTRQVCVTDSDPEECLEPAPTCTPEQVANGGCPLEGLSPDTCYTVYATAIAADGSRYTSATPANFCTGTLPVAELASPPTPLAAAVKITPPSKGGPFDSYRLKVGGRICMCSEGRQCVLPAPAWPGPCAHRMPACS